MTTPTICPGCQEPMEYTGIPGKIGKQWCITFQAGCNKCKFYVTISDLTTVNKVSFDPPV